MNLTDQIATAAVMINPASASQPEKAKHVMLMEVKGLKDAIDSLYEKQRDIEITIRTLYEAKYRKGKRLLQLMRKYCMLLKIAAP